MMQASTLHVGAGGEEVKVEMEDCNASKLDKNDKYGPTIEKGDDSMGADI